MHGASDNSDPVLQLTSGLPIDEVHRRLREASRATDLGHRMLAFYLHEMQERRLFQTSGHSSAIHYATTRLGMSRRRARELVAAGRMLEQLEEIDSAFCKGELSWSKVRLLTEVAVAETQKPWIDRAAELSCRELEHEVRASERGRPPRKDRLGLPAPSFTVRASLDALGQAGWEAARRKLGEELERTITDEELLRHLAEAFLSGSTERGGDGNPEKNARSSYQVVVHQCPDCGGAAAETTEGPVPLQREMAAMVACDGERVSLSREPGGEPAKIDRPTPSWLRRAVLARDGGRCRNCNSRWGPMVHHVRFRSEGGPTRAENLVSLCGRCHGLVHSGLLRIEGTCQDQLRFTDRGGRGVAGFDSVAGPVLELLARGARAPGGDAQHGLELEGVPEEVDADWWRAHEHQLVWNPRTRRFALGRAGTNGVGRAISPR